MNLSPARRALTTWLPSLLWILPFCGFFIGYIAMSSIYQARSFETPSIVGQQLAPALKTLSELKLNIRLIKETEDPNLPENTILVQIPRPGQRIKPHQTVNCIVSKNTPPLAPNLVDQSEESIRTALDAQGLRPKKYIVPSKAPAGRCIGQIPQVAQPVSDQKIVTYFPDTAAKPVIVPDLATLPLFDVLEFCSTTGIQPMVTYRLSDTKHRPCHACKVLSQKPLAGSFITLDTHPVIHLTVGHAP